jgi:hypothetical protein
MTEGVFSTVLCGHNIYDTTKQYVLILTVECNQVNHILARDLIYFSLLISMSFNQEDICMGFFLNIQDL